MQRHMLTCPVITKLFYSNTFFHHLIKICDNNSVFNFFFFFNSKFLSISDMAFQELISSCTLTSCYVRIKERKTFVQAHTHKERKKERKKKK